MRTLERALLLLTFGLLFVGAGRAQGTDTFAGGSGSSGSNSAGPGGQYDASVCNDPRIPIMAAQQKATPYHDPNWNTPGDPLKLALGILAQKYDNSNINNAGACANAPGVVYMVPTNLIPEVTKLIGQIETSESGGGGNNGTGGTPTSGTPTGGTPTSGQPISGGTNGGNRAPAPSGNNGGPRGGPPPNYAPTPGPAGGIGYRPGPNPCLPKGPGGYNYCNNGPGAHLPAGCFCDGQPPAPATQNTNPTPQPTPAGKPARNPNQPLVDSVQWTAGFVNGLGDCVQGMVNMAAAAGWIVRGLARDDADGAEFIEAADLLGLKPGQSLVLRQIAQESQAKVSGGESTPFDAGNAGGRRLCAYGLVPGVAKASKYAKYLGNGKTPPGGSPLNPLSGQALTDAVSDGSAGAAKLAGTWVQTPRGPMQLGNFMGKGRFGSVYQRADNPGQVIKIATNDPNAAGSFPNQVQGSNLLKKIGVPTAAIRDVMPGKGGQPSMMVMDNVFQKPGAFQATSNGLMKTQATIDAGTQGASLPPMGQALVDEVMQVQKQLADQIGNGGLIAGDLHLGNIVFTRNAQGGLTATVVDADLIGTKANVLKELGGQEGSDILTAIQTGKPVSDLLAHVAGTLESGGVALDALSSNLTPQGVMDALSQARQNIAAAAKAAQAAKQGLKVGTDYVPPTNLPDVSHTNPQAP